MKNPAEGTDDITVTLSATARCTFGAASWSGVQLVDTFGTVASDSGFGVEISVDVTSESGEVVIDACGCDAEVLIKVGADQDERWNRLGNPGAISISSAGSSEDGADTVTMYWTWAGGANWATIGVPLKPAAPRVSRRPGLGFMFVEEPELLAG
ncbi:hypothetical protein ES703_126091 [subsurface metagenome]